MDVVTTETPKKTGKVSERTCVGCRATDAKDALVRFAIADEEPFLVPDLAGKLGGRGVSLHPRLACVRAAVKGGGFAKSLKRPTPFTVQEAVAVLSGAIERRMEGLVGAARRSRTAAFGTDAVREALFGGKVALLVVATDAAGRRADVEALADGGGVPRVTWGTKESLGRILGRDQISVIAILDAGIAAGLTESAARLHALSEVE